MDDIPDCAFASPEDPRWNEAKFLARVELLADILDGLDEFDTPKRKLPNCPRCDEDELGVIHANLILCYKCGWKMEASLKHQRKQK